MAARGGGSGGGTSGGGTLTSYEWRMNNIRWRLLFAYQDFSGLLLLVPAAVLLGVAHFKWQDHPVQRQVLLYDASISLPHDHNVAVSDALAVLFNWIILVLVVLIVELGVYFQRQPLTAALAAVVHHIWCCAISFLIVLTIAEITKPFSGRLRPDFLARCYPEGAFSAAAKNLSGGASLHLGQMAGACTQTNEKTLIDGRRSFPSGHSANSMSVAFYSAIYFLHGLYVRQGSPFAGRVYRARGLGARLLLEALAGLAYGLVVCALCLSWFIGLTRFWDNVHAISDITGGFLLAIIFTTPYLVKALGMHATLHEHIVAAEADAASGLHGGSALPVCVDKA